MAVYISEIKFENSDDFVEIVATDGEDLSSYSVAVYNSTGDFQSSHTLAGEYHTTLAGNDGYLVDQTDGLPNMGSNWAVALVDNLGNVVKFISDHSSAITAVDGPAVGMTSDNYGNITAGGESLETTDGGTTYSAQSSPNPGTIPCYAPGTLIDTPDGPRAVETLRPGDLVLTADHGPQPIRWVRSGDHPLECVETDAKPVLISAGALGLGLPTQDLIVSPQHRMVVGGGGQLDAWFKSEAFAPAKSLTGLHGVRHMKGKTAITWIHFACDRHEVVTANGCLSESLLLGPMVINGLARSERNTLKDIFGPGPKASETLNGPAARECLKVGEVRRHITKCKKDKTRCSGRDFRKWDLDLANEKYEADRLREAAA